MTSDLETVLLCGLLDTSELGSWARRVVRRYHQMFGESLVLDSLRAAEEP